MSLIKQYLSSAKAWLVFFVGAGILATIGVKLGSFAAVLICTCALILIYVIWLSRHETTKTKRILRILLLIDVWSLFF